MSGRSEWMSKRTSNWPNALCVYSIVIQLTVRGRMGKMNKKLTSRIQNLSKTKKNEWHWNFSMVANFIELWRFHFYLVAKSEKKWSRIKNRDSSVVVVVVLVVVDKWSWLGWTRYIEKWSPINPHVNRDFGYFQEFFSRSFLNQCVRPFRCRSVHMTYSMRHYTAIFSGRRLSLLK